MRLSKKVARALTLLLAVLSCPLAYSENRVSKGGKHIQQNFVPVGFGRGHFAYTETVFEDAQGCHHLVFRVVSIHSSRIAEEVSRPIEEGCVEQHHGLPENAFEAEYAALVRRYAIITQGNLDVQAFPLEHGGRTVTVSLSDVGAAVQGEFETLSPITVMLLVGNRSPKVVGVFNQVELFGEREVHSPHVEGYIRSAAGDLVVVVSHTLRGHHGPPDLTGVVVYGINNGGF